MIGCGLLEKFDYENGKKELLETNLSKILGETIDVVVAKAPLLLSESQWRENPHRISITWGLSSASTFLLVLSHLLSLF